MKKYTLLPIIAATLLAGCTTKEQDAQIRTFWMMQSLEVMNKLATPANMAKLSQLAAARTAGFGAMGAPHINFPENLPEPVPAQTAPAASAKRVAPAPQMIDVTMDTDELPGKATPAERAKMKRAFEAVQINNQATLSSIENSFNASVKHKAFLITTQTEKDLKAAAANSADFPAYFAEQKRLLALQEQKITQLMKQNAANLKRTRRPARR